MSKPVEILSGTILNLSNKLYIYNMAKRIQKKIPVKRSRVAKTRNSGTMSESAFWSFIRSALRQKSRWWKPIAECKAKAKRPYTGPLKRQKFEYQCNQCKGWYPEKKINVDHICPAGSLNSAQDLPGFIERLFCEIDNLQVLCISCHDIKSKEDKLKLTKQ
jgi:5-methylcytosine-specific restriction endonuclease McrA